MLDGVELIATGIVGEVRVGKENGRGVGEARGSRQRLDRAGKLLGQRAGSVQVCDDGGGDFKGLRRFVRRDADAQRDLATGDDVGDERGVRPLAVAFAVEDFRDWRAGDERKEVAARQPTQHRDEHARRRADALRASDAEDVHRVAGFVVRVEPNATGERRDFKAPDDDAVPADLLQPGRLDDGDVRVAGRVKLIHEGVRAADGAVTLEAGERPGGVRCDRIERPRAACEAAPEPRAGEVANEARGGAVVGRAVEIERVALPDRVRAEELCVEGEVKIRRQRHHDAAPRLRHRCAAEWDVRRVVCGGDRGGGGLRRCLGNRSEAENEQGAEARESCPQTEGEAGRVCAELAGWATARSDRAPGTDAPCQMLDFGAGQV